VRTETHQPWRQWETPIGWPQLGALVVGDRTNGVSLHGAQQVVHAEGRGALLTIEVVAVHVHRESHAGAPEAVTDDAGAEAVADEDAGLPVPEPMQRDSAPFCTLDAGT
jgi:hypothetical protein